MDPHPALVARAIPILVYLEIGLITLGIPVTHKQPCHGLVHFFTDFRHKRVYPVDDGLLCQEDPLHPVIQGLPVKRQAEHELPVKDVRYDGAGYGAFVEQRVSVGDGKKIMLQTLL